MCRAARGRRRLASIRHSLDRGLGQAKLPTTFNRRPIARPRKDVANVEHHTLRSFCSTVRRPIDLDLQHVATRLDVERLHLHRACLECSDRARLRSAVVRRVVRARHAAADNTATALNVPTAGLIGLGLAEAELPTGVNLRLIARPREDAAFPCRLTSQDWPTASTTRGGPAVPPYFDPLTSNVSQQHSVSNASTCIVPASSAVIVHA
mmetsp:Transcript_116388/g.370250  ORF Transcript_116388/g.370250 Transcript_116388/m.370250 type:complete len:208 (+) Transcript_116388:1686-2309(+)